MDEERLNEERLNEARQAFAANAASLNGNKGIPQPPFVQAVHDKATAARNKLILQRSEPERALAALML